MQTRVLCSALLAAAALGGAAIAAPAPAPDAAAPPPELKLNLLETLDLWDNASGGVRTGGDWLSKLRVSATWNGERMGDPGLNVHVQVFATNGPSFSTRYVGDIQTLSNIDAPVSVRLFEAWADQAFGDRGSLRLGLIDVNHDFDINYPVGLFIASSDAIGPELSKSGRNGPSIFPVSSFGARWNWTPNQHVTLHTAIVDGVSGDPAHPGAFAAVRLSPSDGVLALAQLDYKPSDDATAAIGVWGYSARTPRIDPARPGQQRQAGVYGFVGGNLSKTLAAWVRIGVSDPSVDIVSNFEGAGLVWNGPFPSRGKDQAGLAVAHAGISPEARRVLGLPAAETSIEATYLFVATDNLSLQPDVQYIVHPASAPQLPNALVVGLRFILNLNQPADAQDTDD